MKTAFLYSFIFSIFYLLSLQLNGQVASEYFYGKPYSFSLESDLEEIDSINEVIKSYQGVNDILYLENIIYKFERLAFLPDDPAPEFDYASFYEQILHIDNGKLAIGDMRKNDPGNNLPYTLLKVKREIYNRYLEGYLKLKDFENALNYLRLRIEMDHVLLPYSDVWYYQPFITDETAFEVYYGLQNASVFLEAYGRHFWDHFIWEESYYFETRAMPFIEYLPLLSPSGRSLVVLQSLVPHSLCPGSTQRLVLAS